eukprot:TRINITY_DN1008_c0_g1_i1.p1 TRINITY_DN1008_c0_g1~~TRINITY_DN1008_c0_g1_i1.p1  ORF type:complete len:195 (-),score=65.04 TRINITY_DN1008_c0_g1_i1:18-602(-)
MWMMKRFIRLNTLQDYRFWEYLNGYVDAPPNRERPFIAEIGLDSTASFIEKTALFWKGYKYIIQPSELYDGWWKSPLEGVGDIPSESKAVQVEPQPISRTEPNPNTIGDLDIDSVAWSTLRMNEYLFRIDVDPAETQNVRMNVENQDILQSLRDFLMQLPKVLDYIAQDSSTSVDADPRRFGNVWYPFEEDYHG